MEPLSSTQALPHGYQLNDYLIQRVVARDKFGISYLAACGSDEHLVIIREHMPSAILHRAEGSYLVTPAADTPEAQDNAAWATECFLEEARALHSLDHPGILKVEAVFQALGTAYYVQPAADGDPLGTRMEAIKAPDAEGLGKLLSTLLGALGAIHQLKLVHANINPGSVIIKKDGSPLLTDFGYTRAAISKRMGDNAPAHAAYTPIEQLQTNGKTGPWSDCYALGATIHRLLTGHRPPTGLDRLDENNDPLPLLHCQPELVKRYGKPILKSIDRALQIKAADRWQSTEAWLRKLPKPLPQHNDDTARHEASTGKAVLSLLASLSVAIGGICLGIYGYTQHQQPEYTGEEAKPAPCAVAQAVPAVAPTAGQATAETTTEQVEQATREPEKTPVDVPEPTTEELAVLNENLLQTMREGRDDKAMALLARKADATTKDKQGWTALHWAAWYGAQETVQKLLDSGADPHACNAAGFTPLHAAAIHGKAGTVRILLAQGGMSTPKTTAAKPHSIGRYGGAMRKSSVCCWTPMQTPTPQTKTGGPPCTTP